MVYALRGPSCRLLFGWLVLLCIPVAVAATPPLPQTPAPVRTLLSVHAFTLENGFVYDWSAERPTVTEGLLLVLEVDPAFLRPRETQEPVLFAGPYPVQRLLWNLETGRLVILVPAKVDLTKEPIWFGTPGLPEEIDRATALAERGVAAAAGIRPLSSSIVSQALSRGGGETRYVSKTELLQAAATM